MLLARGASEVSGVFRPVASATLETSSAARRREARPRLLGGICGATDPLATAPLATAPFVAVPLATVPLAPVPLETDPLETVLLDSEPWALPSPLAVGDPFPLLSRPLATLRVLEEYKEVSVQAGQSH